MHRFRALLLFALLFVPVIAFAQSGLPLLDPNWHIVPDPSVLAPGKCEPSDPLGIGGVIVLLQNLMNAAVSLTVIVMTLVIAYAGFLFLTSPFSSENRSKAKTTLWNTAVGVALVLSAWLIMDFAMKVLYNPEATFAGKAIGPWNQVLVGGDACITKGKTEALFGGIPVSTAPEPDPNAGRGPVAVAGAGGSGSSSRPGRCTVQTSGPCAPANLSVFGAAANQASQICYAESTNVIDAVSGSDRMRNDPTRRAFSFGLFQINITQHEVGGLDCPKAFRGKDYSAVVIDERLYAQCAAAAKDPNKNIAEALATYKRTQWKEWSTGKTCGLAQDAGSPFAGALSFWL